MEPNQIDQQPTSLPTPPPSPAVASSVGGSQPSKLPIMLLSLISLLSLSGLVYFYLQTQSLKQQQVKQGQPKMADDSEEKVVAPSPPSSPLSTDNWKIYTDPSSKYTLKYPSNWKGLESDCQLLDVQIENSELNINEYTKKAYGFSDTNLQEYTVSIPENYKFMLPQFTQDEQLVFGPTGEAEIANIIVDDPKTTNYAKIVVWFNGDPAGDNTKCNSIGNEYRDVLSTFQFIDPQ